MTPPFDIEGGLPLALARFVSVSGLVAASGSLFYARLLRPAGLAPAIVSRLRRLCFAGIGFGILGALVWLAAETRDIAGDVQPSDVWIVLSGTLFGHLVAARLLLLALAAASLAWRLDFLAVLLALTALLLQAGHSHALAMGGSPILLASSTLHLLAAGIWLGGLVPLWLVVGQATPETAYLASRRFSLAGLACVAVLLVTATWQFDRLVVNIPGLVGTAYGWMVCVKIVLFAGLIALAARNRWRLTPRLGNPSAKSALRSAILLEVVLGLAVLAAAGVLTELQPPMHTQKLWPFSWVPSLDAAREDADVARETMWAGIAIGLSLAVLAGAAMLRRRRLEAVGAALAACLIAGLALPHLSPLLVPAVPTEFYRSPTGFSVASIVQGDKLYPRHCAVCHGVDGHGDGPLARTLPVPPADLTAPHLWMHADGELFWWLTHGIEGPRGGLVMPGFASLSDDDRWALIDFIRARNAGGTLGASGWTTQMKAPDFAVVCPNGAQRLTDLRGGIVEVVLATPDGGVTAGQPGVTTVMAAPNAPRPSAACHSANATIQAAYGIAAPGAKTVLIDANGWLRAASTEARPVDPTLAARALPPARPRMNMDADMDMAMPAGMKM